MIVVTTSEVPGYRIDAVLGEALGVVVCTTVRPGFSSGLRAGNGGEVPEASTSAYHSRREAISRLVTEATSRGANAIVGMRQECDSIDTLTQFTAYGTAVVIEAIPAGQPGSTPQSARVVDA
ncbi:YbjQ family protein [Cellulomonas composti]|uniref:UPF0145 protein n=1 Tax=Cellulomonas composti TaxID=266130 RepID=A0A511J8T5_9CELL|nr:heavy metal-binding domain-containing protein [Cellulomonas composti]GEL94407.1 UPF0145 protein [Cellulomonas composti]